MDKDYQLFSIKNDKDPTKCPFCGSKLQSCHIGGFCGKKECPYVDGYTWLTKEETKKFAHLILQ